MARGVLALQPERKSLVQELGLAGLQVWQSLSEATGRGRAREMAVMFTDLVGFSSWALKAGDAITLELLREVGNRRGGRCDPPRGRTVKRLGDGVMATFLDPRAAVDAALDAQDAVAAIDARGRFPECGPGCIGALRASSAGTTWGST